MDYLATIANNYDRDDEEEADFVLTRGVEAEEETRGRIEIALPDKYRRVNWLSCVYLSLLSVWRSCSALVWNSI